MKLYLKKDYWFQANGEKFAIVYKTKVEKNIKWAIHFLLGKTPIIYFNSGKGMLYEKLKQKAFQPIVRRNNNGKIKDVLPYYNESLLNLFEALKNKYPDIKRIDSSTDYSETRDA